MKIKIVLPLSCIILLASSFTPITLIPVKPTITADAMNIIYAHIQNPIHIGYNNFSARKTEVIAIGISLGKKSAMGNKYNLIADAGAKEAKISIVKNKKNGEQRKISSQIFRIRELPAPLVQLGGIGNDGKAISKQLLFAQTHLNAKAHQSFPYQLDFKIVSYELEIRTKAGKEIHKMDNDKFPLKLKNDIRKMESGDLLLFTNIAYSVTNSTDGFEGIAPSFFIEVE